MHTEDLADSTNYLFFFIFFIILLLNSLFLTQFSPDFHGYLNLFHQSHYNFLAYEPTFYLIVYLNNNFFNGYWFTFYLFYESFILFLFIVAIKKYSENIFLSFLIFSIVFLPLLTITQIRQGVSVGLFIIAIEDIVNRKPIKYYFKIILAILFHYSSIILIPLYFIKPNKINKLFYFLLPLIGIFIYKFLLNINTITFLNKLMPIFIQARMNSYILFTKKHINGYNKINLLSFYHTTLFLIYLVSIFIIDMKNKTEIVWVKILGIGFFFWFSFANIPILSFRINNFFFPSLIFILPYLLKYIKQKQFFLSLLILYCLLLYSDFYIFHKFFH